MDINQVVQNAVSEINFEEIAKAAAVDKIQEAVKKAVEDQLKSYSKFGEKLNEHIKNELSVDFSTIKLPAYREFLLGAVNDSLVSFMSKEHAKEIADHINGRVIGETRDEIEFQRFFEELSEMITEECEETDHERYHLEFHKEDKSYSWSSNYHKLTISEKKDSYSGLSEKQSEVIYAALSDGVIYHMRTNDNYELSKIATWLKALKFRKTKILNPGSEDVNLPDRGY